MDISSIKSGFKLYLEELNETSNKKYNTVDSDISIFLYADEFKDYLLEEYSVDAQILSMNTSDILNVDIENGKLINPDAKEETTDETSFNNFSFDVINDLLEDESFKTFIDADGDGNLDDKEIQNFLESIKTFDENATDISLDDIASAYTTFGNQELLNAAANDKEENPYNGTTKEPETEQAPQAKANTESKKITEAPKAVQSFQGNNKTGATKSSGNRGYSNYGGGSPVYNKSGNSTNKTQEKSLSNMSIDKLKAELLSAKDSLKEKQGNLNDILNGTDSKLKQLEENVQTAYDIYSEKVDLVDNQLAEELNEIKTNLDAKEKEIDAKEIEISSQETTVSECKTSYENAVETKDSLDSLISDLKSTDTSKMNDEQKSKLESNISTLEQKLEQAKLNVTDTEKNGTKRKIHYLK